MKASQKIRMNFLWIVFLIPSFAMAQQAVDWSFNYGGSSADVLSRIINSSSGGFLASGFSMSSDADLPSNDGGYDAWAIKITETGQKEFVTVLGGSSSDYAKDIVEVDGSHYLMLIDSYSSDGDFPVNLGNSDVWIKSFSLDGSIAGSLHFGGSGDDNAIRLIPAAAGGHLIIGRTNSSDGTFVEGYGGYDGFCIRLTQNSQVAWVKQFGTKENDGFVDALTLPDGNLLFLGSIYQTTQNTGWLLKTNSLGESITEKRIEKASGIFPVCIQLHAGHIYVAANTNNLVSRVTDRHMIIYKFDENLDFVGSIETGGAGGSDMILDMKPYDNNHLLCLITSNTDNWPFQGNHGGYDLFYTLISNDFELVHTRPFGGSNNEGMSGQNGNFVLDGTNAIAASNSNSSDGDVPANYGLADGWIFKANPTYSLGLPQFEKDILPGMIIQPNPASDYIEVLDIPENSSIISICNLTGQTIKTHDLQPGINRFSVNDLPPGLYILHAHGKGTITASARFIKQ